MQGQIQIYNRQIANFFIIYFNIKQLLKLNNLNLKLIKDK